MWRKVLFLFVFSALAVAAAGSTVAWASQPAIELDGRYWITNINGNVNVPDSGLAVGKTDIDLKSDLGVRDKNVPDLRLIWHTGENSWLRLSYTKLDYSGDNTLSETIQFRGKTYNANSRVLSSLNVTYLSLGWAWQFIHFADESVRLGTLISARGFWTKASLNDPEFNVNEEKSIAFGLPTIGATADINPISMLDIFGEFSWMTAGKYGHLYDTEAGVKIIPIRYVSIEGGYRIFDVTAKDDPDYATLKIEGPFVGGTLRF